MLWRSVACRQPKRNVATVSERWTDEPLLLSTPILRTANTEMQYLKQSREILRVGFTYFPELIGCDARKMDRYQETWSQHSFTTGATTPT